MSTEVTSEQRQIQPYRNVGLIFAVFPDGTRIQGTCSLVGRNDIITAAHVVYDPDRGGWAENYEFHFGADYNNHYDIIEDYGYSYYPDKWEITAWPNQVFTDFNNDMMTMSEAQFDIAIIGIDNPIGDDIGWLGLSSGYDVISDSTAIGYPDFAPGMMKETVTVHDAYIYDIYESDYDVMGPGSSGGPLVIDNYVIGVKSTGSWWADVGFLFDQIVEIMDENNSLIVPPPDLDPPIIVSLTPADAATGVSIESNIVISFSEAIQRGTGNIILKTAAGATVATYSAATSPNLSLAGDILTINPSVDLAYGTQYKVEFAAGTIKDLAGNNFAGTTSYDFTTIGLNLMGTPQDDTLTGTMVADTIKGAAGNDTINGLGGHDVIDGGTGVDTFILNVSTANVLSYPQDLMYSPGHISQVGSNLGVAQLNGIERVQLNDGLFAFDTLGPDSENAEGGKVWQVEALFQAAFGRLANMNELSQWAVQADQSADMGEFGQRMIDFYAPGISSEGLVSHLYFMLTDTFATPQEVQGFVDQIGPSRTFETQGDLFASAASLDLNTVELSGVAGSIQVLDPGWF